MHRYTRKTLYLGLDPRDPTCVHYPVIRTQPRPSKDLEMYQAFADLPCYTHLLFTSKQAVFYFFQQSFDRKLLARKVVIAIGRATAKELEKHDVGRIYCPKEETQEGLIALLERMAIEPDAYFFYPRSSLARPLLAQFLEKWHLRLFDLYTTRYQKLEPVPDLSEFDRIIFTSPSTVRGFLNIFGALPRDKELIALGPVTKKELSKYAS